MKERARQGKWRHLADLPGRTKHLGQSGRPDQGPQAVGVNASCSGEALAADATKEQERLDAMKSLTKAILADLQAFDKNGPKTPKELAEQQARLTKNMAEFRDKFMEGRKVDVGDLLGLDQLQRRVTLALEGGISKVEIDKLYSAPDTFAEFRDEIEKGIGPVRVWIKAAQTSNVEIANATKGMSAEETLNYLSKAEAQSKEVITSYHAARDALVVAEGTVRKGREEVNSAFSHWLAAGAGKSTGGGTLFDSVVDYFTEMRRIPQQPTRFVTG